MDFMVDAFLCLVLDVFGLASKCSPFGMDSLSVGLISEAESQCFGDLDSRFLVALAPASDFLLFAKTLLVGASTVW